jgi:hypothetical protein
MPSAWGREVVMQNTDLLDMCFSFVALVWLQIFVGGRFFLKPVQA